MKEKRAGKITAVELALAILNNKKFPSNFLDRDLNGMEQ